MKRSLFTVEEFYTIKGRGIVIGPGLSINEYAELKVGDNIELRTPDGGIIATKIAGKDYPPSFKYLGTPPPVKERKYGILLPEDIRKEDIPVGTEVWKTE